MGCCKSKKVTVITESTDDEQDTLKSQHSRVKPLPINRGCHPISQPDINVLLLGESGVGKSTFINALINYLTFDSLEQARLGQPIVTIPVSFVMTQGDNFEERIVQFGEQDQNEDYNQPGQSVTQHCKSYTFNVGTKHKLNLIDTPGMGDTRGVDQDDLNMQHILSYIDNLSHLNAICILLKPNESKLNVVLRSYFTQLLTFLGEKARDNIVFCFTNTRSTFYSPGDTGPLLKKMLNNLSIKNVPFNKTNTFCFDSESFRYLVAQLDGIRFDSEQRQEYEQSWTISMNESNRFLHYVCSTLKRYPHINWQSIEHARYCIQRIIRPLLETIRNHCRNNILVQEKSSDSQLKVTFTAAPQSSTICSNDTCKRIPQQYSGFYILLDDVHLYLGKCNKCQCNRESHTNIHYELHYKSTDNAAIDNLDELMRASIDFGYFLLYTNQNRESNDTVFTYLNQMINEEHRICQDKGSQDLNGKLNKKLIQIKDEYEQRRSALITSRKPTDLPSIYKLIQQINEILLTKI